MKIFAEKHLICNADIRHTQICKLRVIVEKVENFVRGTEMARGARSGARKLKKLLAGRKSFVRPSFWWVCHLCTTNTSS